MKLQNLMMCIAVSGSVVAAADPPPIIPPDVAVETVSTGGFSFTEGPALAPDGSIYFTDIPNNAIHRYDPATGETTLFTDDSGGANGLAFLPDHGMLIACAGKARQVRYYPRTWDDEESRWTGLTQEPSLEDAVSHYKGKQLNSPNDLVVTFNSIYFTDPRYGKRDDLELPSEAVFAMVPDAAEGAQGFRLVRVIDDLVRPNGIGISPDHQTLYVNDNGDKKIWAYPIPEPTELGEARLLNDLADLGGPDGMTVGPRGRIYTTIYGKGVLILSPQGERLGFLETGPQTTNCTFGADGRTLYVTAEKGLKRVTLNTGGPTEE
ncbi:MAG: SMP-30/gluconolactonase/LRE family protein [Planctomycetota bacterium]